MQVRADVHLVRVGKFLLSLGLCPEPVFQDHLDLCRQESQEMCVQDDP